MPDRTFVFDTVSLGNFLLSESAWLLVGRRDAQTRNLLIREGVPRAPPEGLRVLAPGDSCVHHGSPKRADVLSDAALNADVESRVPGNIEGTFGGVLFPRVLARKTHGT